MISLSSLMAEWGTPAVQDTPQGQGGHLVPEATIAGSDSEVPFSSAFELTLASMSFLA